MSRFSYRVAYRREGGKLLTRHYETYSSACRKVRRLKSIEAAKLAGEFEGTPLDHAAPLVEIRLERREVQPWTDDPYQPEPTKHDAKLARDYAELERDRAGGVERDPWAVSESPF